jgi:hypothetical protein
MRTSYVTRVSVFVFTAVELWFFSQEKACRMQDVNGWESLVCGGNGIVALLQMARKHLLERN